ncbi:stress response protein ish1, conidia-enriched transcript [Histoplasma capsulatum]|uniref:Stress response protein ish1, conidia-enriched transcript n=1 Tax=Ajellomyces capsulatus TaxID=5037 RepID=A0A8A1MJE4_AJECA|nr:stress response protein ish1, conidia-enriched transcript [Histoplasma capsulatum]
MRLSWALGLVVTILTVTETACLRNWFSKAVYNRWHETELERWLSDHDIPYPTPADRKDLEELVKNNWESRVQIPIHHTAEHVADYLGDAKEWIFDTWSDSQLKTFLDKHGISSPQPNKRDKLLAVVRENFEAIARKLGQTTFYPGNWLYEQWSESDLKEYLDSHGYHLPQPTTRDKLVASVRRNARLAGIKSRQAAASASSSAEAAQKSLSEALFNAWSESEFKEFFDKHGIKVPQGSRRNELIALARKHRASLLQKPTASITHAYGAATSKAGNEFARATEDVRLRAADMFNSAISQWSDSRLRAYLDARGVQVPQGTKRDELLAKVRLHRRKAMTGFSAWTFDTWTKENLGKYMSSQHQKMMENVEYTRDELLRKAKSAYNQVSSAGGEDFAAVTNYLTQQVSSTKDAAFDTWSRVDLEKYIDSYGLKGYKTWDIDKLRAEARRNANFFRYGELAQEATLVSRLEGGIQWVLDQLKIGMLSGRREGERVADNIKETVSHGTQRMADEL